MSIRKCSMVACTSAVLISGAAVAQSQSTADTEGRESLEEIVVTGTLIRGVAPAGANVIGVSEQEVQATGVSTTAQLLETIPQIGVFNSLQLPSPGGINQVTTNRPNLRNLPGFNTAGSSSTLVLMDGRRLVGMGIQATSPDPDVIPPGMIERVEIVPDGGSAIYGSDAVAGVMNFVTRKKYDGVKVDARYGTADDYHTADANLTAGFSWDSGSFLASYNYSEHDAIYGRDRDYVKMPLTNISGNTTLPVTSLRCAPVGNVAVSGTFYALPYTTGNARPNTANQCDESDAASVYPEQSKHSFFASVSQALSDSTTLDVAGYYSERQVDSVVGGFLTSSTIAAFALPQFGFLTSPFRASHLVNPANAFTETQTVYYTWGDPDANRQDLSLDSWGIAPTLIVDLSDSWQLRALASYGESSTENHLRTFNTTALNNSITAGLFNPYDPGTSNPSALAAIDSSETFGLTEQRLFNGRVVADGDLFALPGGAVKLAVGLEYIKEELKAQTGSIVRGTQDTGFPGLSINNITIIPATNPLPVVDLDRDITAAFAEVSIPIVGADNALPGIRALSLSASGRYDDYSDFGDTSNPRFGLTYKPFDSVTLRGAWGTSFVAPSLADSEAAQGSTALFLNTFPFLYPPQNLQAPNGPYPAVVPGQFIVITQGNADDIQPQEADTWSVGLDFQPTPGLNLSLTYWNIEYQGVIGVPPFFNQIAFWSTFGQLITVQPTQAQLDAVVSSVSTPPTNQCAPQPTCVYAISDGRKQNLGLFKLDGLDFGTNYVLDTGFGSIDFVINANYELNREQSPIIGAPLADLLSDNVSRFRMRVGVGAQIGNFRAQASLNHSEGYDLNPPVGAIGPGAPPQQTSVDSFNVVNLFFRYDIKAPGLLEDLAFTLNVNNVADEEPPEYLASQITNYNQGFANGGTVGRLIQFGISKEF